MMAKEEILVKCKRIDWVDFAKGITIILVIVGHTLSVGKAAKIIQGAIFSFHMPLFFILSAITFHFSNSIEEFINSTKKALKHLLIPALFIYLFRTLIIIVQNPILLTDLAFWKSKVLTLLFASGVDLTIGNTKINAIGIPWFLFALFLGRTIFDFVQLNCKGRKALLLILSSIMASIGVALGSKWVNILSFDIALAIIPFIYFGYVLTNVNIGEQPIILFCHFPIYMDCNTMYYLS